MNKKLVFKRRNIFSEDYNMMYIAGIFGIFLGIYTIVKSIDCLIKIKEIKRNIK